MFARSVRVRYWVWGLLAMYLGSYLTLSRVGFQQADAMGVKGFYYVTPIGPVTRSLNCTLYLLYYPVMAVDNALGTGRPAASLGHRLSQDRCRHRVRSLVPDALRGEKVPSTKFDMFGQFG